MPTMYPDSPQNCKLYLQHAQESLQKLNQKKEIGKQELKVSDVFFVTHQDSSVEAVTKDSMQGLWLSIKEKLASIFHVKSLLGESKDTLIKSVTTYAQSRLISSDRSISDFIDDLGTTYNVQAIEEIKQKALQEQQAVAPAPISFSTVLGPIGDDNKVVQTFEANISNQSQPISEALTRMMPEFTPEQTQTLARRLVGYAGKEELLKAAQPDKQTHFLGLLERALLEASRDASDEDFEVFEEPLKKVQTKLPQKLSSEPKGPSDSLDLNSLTTVLGNAFTEDMQPDMDIKKYANLTVNCLKNRGKMSPEATRLAYTLSNAVDLTAKKPTAGQLRDQIKAIMDKCPKGDKGERCCLFFGELAGTPVVYEMERKDKKCTFRIYHQGNGITSHDKVEQGYRTKYSCFYSLEGIDEKVMLRRSFLYRLQTLTRTEELYHDTLPLLGGTREPISEASSHHFVQIPEKGSPAYRSLKSFMAHFLNKNDYRRLTLENSLYLLKGHLPIAQDKLKNLQIALSTPENYRFSRTTDVSEYQQLKKTIEIFELDLHKHSAQFDQETLQEIEKITLQYSICLKQIQECLFKLDSRTLGINELTTTPATSCPKRPYTLPLVLPPQGKQVEVYSQKLSPAIGSIFKAIDAMPKPLNAQGIETVISAIRTGYESLSERDKIRVLDQFFKAIGPVSNFKTIKYADSQAKILLESVGILLEMLESTESTPFMPLNHRASFSLALYYLSECAFHQLPADEQVLDANSSFLHAMPWEQLSQIVPLDPYWESFVKELHSQATSEQNPTKYTLPDLKSNHFTMTEKMSQAIKGHWQKWPLELQSAIAASIQKDRAAQEVAIKAKEDEQEGYIREEDKKLAATQKELNRLQTMSADAIPLSASEEYKISKLNTAYLKRTYRESVKNTQIQDLKDNIIKHIPYWRDYHIRCKANARSEVERDSQYWPKGWEEQPKSEMDAILHKDESILYHQIFLQNKLIDDLKNKFLLSSQKFLQNKLAGKDLLPASFRALFLGATRVANSFLNKPEHVDYGMKLTQGHLRYILALNTSNQSAANTPPSPIFSSLTWEWKNIFTFLEKSKKEGEGSAPALSQDCPSMNDRTATQEDIRALLACRQKEVQIESLLAFFEENRDKLDDPNWVLLLHHMLFESHVLLDALNDPKQREQVIRQLDDFFNQQQANAALKGNFTQVGNLMMVEGTLRKYLAHTATTEAERQTHLSLDKVRDLLQQGLQDTKQRPVFLEGLAAYSQVAFAQGAQEKDIETAILVNLLSKQHPIPHESSLEFRAALASTLAEKVIEHFATHPPQAAQQILSPESLKLLGQAFPGLGELRQKADQPDCLETINGDTRISLSAGELATSNPLLKSIASKPNERIIQRLSDLQLYTKEEAQTLICKVDGIATYITDPQRKLSFIDRNGAVYIQLDKIGWCQCHTAKEMGETHHELSNRFHYVTSGSTTYLCDRTTFKPAFQVDASGVLTNLETKLQFASSTLFQSFETPTCSYFWTKPNSKNLERVDFPRMDLSFARNEKGQLQCIGQKDWFISSKQWAPHLSPHFGFLSLENEKGEKKVLLPLLDVPGKFQTEERSIQYVEYELQGTKLVPTTVEARYQLADLYLKEGFFNLAEELLFSHAAETTASPLSDKARALLEKIAFPHPKAIQGGQKVPTDSQKIRCQMRVLYLLERDALTPREVPEGNSNTKKKAVVLEFNNIPENMKTQLYEQYLKRLGHIKPLDPQQEIFLLEELSNFPTSLKVRAAELMGKEGPSISFKEPYRQAPLFQTDPQAKFSLYAHAPRKLSLPKRLDYYTSRKANTFPFDYTNPKDLVIGFKAFYPSILREVTELKSLSQARKNGCLHLLALAAADPYLSHTKEVTALLGIVNNLPEKNLGEQPASHSRHIPSSKTLTSLMPARKAWDARIIKGMQPLDMLDVLQPSLERDKYLKEQCNIYLTTTQAKITPLAKPLFAANAPEITVNGVPDSVSGPQFERMRTDLIAAKDQLESEKAYTIKPDVDLGALQDSLQKTFDHEAKRQIEQEKLLLQSVHSALTAAPESASKFQSATRSLPTMQELVILCSRPDGANLIQELYPELKDGNKLKIAVGKCLAQKQFVQHLSRCLGKVKDVIEEKEDLDNRQLLLNDLGKSLDAVTARTTDLLTLPALSLETILNLKLREDQVKKIEEFYTAQQEGREIVNQMIMGAGKTAVIQPMLAILLAQSGKLSNVTVPAALYPLVKEELLKVLSGSYERFVFSDPFTRDLAKDSDYLETYLVRLQEAKEKGAVTLMKPQDKYAILSSLKEALLSPEPNTSDEKKLLKERTDTLSAICHLLEISELSQIDEIDMVVDPTVVYKFAIGKKTPINLARANAVTDMMIELIQDEELTKDISKDFITSLKKRQDPQYKPKGVDVSPMLYQTRFVPKLAEIAKKLFASAVKLDLKQADGALTQYLTDFLSGTTPHDKDLLPFSADQQSAVTKSLMALKERNPQAWEQEIALKKTSDNDLERFIALKLSYNHEMDIAFRSFTPEQRDYLGGLAKSIRLVFKKSILEEAGTHYSNDPDAGVYTVRPYSAPNSPKDQMPPDPYEILVKSIQNACYNGIPRDAVIKMLGQLKTAAERESEDNNNKPLPSTAAYLKFAGLVGQQHANRLFESPPREDLIDLLEKRMNQDPESIKAFTKNYIIPQVGFYEKSIETTPQALLGMSSHKVGYTGTMSAGILPSTMKANPALGTDGKTITVIAGKIAKGTSEIMEMDASKKSYLDQVLEVFTKEPKVRVFIDSGNWLKEEVTGVWAEKLLRNIQSQPKRENIKAVVYPNASGKWLCLKIENNKAVVTPYDPLEPKPNERLTIIPSKHETGTNIKQIPTAIAFQSVRKGMTQRDELQSAFRMREILQGQQVFIGVSQDVKDDMATRFLQNILQSDTYKNCLNGKVPVASLPEGWVKEVFEDAGQPISMDSVLSAGCKTFTLQGKQQHLWNYFLKNQIDDQLTKNFQALEHKMREVLEKPIRMVLTDPETLYETRRELAKAMENFFVLTQKDSPYEEMTKSRYEVPIEEAVQSKTAKMQAFYDHLAKNPHLQSLVDAKIAKIYQPQGGKNTGRELLTVQLKSCANFDLLPKSVMVGGGDSDAEVEQEQQQEQQQEQLQEQLVQVEARIPPIQVPILSKQGYRKFAGFTKNGGYDPIGLVGAVGGGGDMRMTATLIDHNLKPLFTNVPLYYSTNMFLDNKLTSHYLLPAHFLLATQTVDGTSRYTLVTHEDAAKIKKGILSSPNPNFTCSLLDFNGKSICSTNPQAVWKKEELDKVILLGKLATATPNFQKEELDLLDQMAAASNVSPIDIKNKFEEILRYKPSSAEKYQKSSIKKFFDKKAAQLRQVPASVRV